nr:immunoglobulin heavy chain junction region [Mus musculus]MBK4186882.1 immunoglobulin heavy chain junction region [Mus musculus]
CIRNDYDGWYFDVW